MKYFKDKIIDNDKAFATILSLNILLSEAEQLEISNDEIRPGDFITPSAKLQTNIISIRPFHKPVTKMQNKKFTSKPTENTKQNG
jgi:hypothetical protein